MANITGTLKVGLKIKDERHTEYEIREPTVADLIDAEEEAPIDRPLAYDRALLCRVLVRVGGFSGPFTPELLNRLKPVDFAALRRALAQSYALGEPEPAEAASG
jgi:phage FluMu protein gp41